MGREVVFPVAFTPNRAGFDPPALHYFILSEFHEAGDE